MRNLTFLFLSIFSFSASAAPVLQAVIAQNVCRPLSADWVSTYGSLLIYNRLDGSGSVLAGNTVTSTVGANGTAVNGNAAGMSFVSGNLNEGVKFGGDDALNFGAVSAVETIYTLSLWVKRGSVTGNIFVRGNQAFCLYNPSLQLSAGGVLTLSENGCGATGQLHQETISATGWTHVAITRNGADVKVFINGDLKVTDSTQPAPTGTTGQISLGATWNSGIPGNSNYSDATLDEFALWTVALTDAQVKEIYSGQICK